MEKLIMIIVVILVSLTSDGNRVAIEAIKMINSTNSGHVHIYENNNGSWTQLGQDIDELLMI